MTQRILSGVQPSGTLHIGNYFGMMKPSLELQQKKNTECLYFIADYHAMTTCPKPDDLRARVFGVALDFLACGLDPEKTIFFRQSDVMEVQELTWILNTLCPVGLLERCHSYKDKLTKGFSPNAALFTYPSLMAADILLYHSNLVPVGKDQKQHLEVTRDLAIRFNNAYGDNALTIPEALIREEVAVVPGIDGQKMSKSYNNTIEIFGEEKKIRKKIMSIITDSTPMEAPKDPDKCQIFSLYKLFATQEQVLALRERYLAGGMGYGHAKQALFEIYWEFFRTAREKRAELENNPDYVLSVLKKGAEKAHVIAAKTMTDIRQKVGLR